MLDHFEKGFKVDEVIFGKMKKKSIVLRGFYGRFFACTFLSTKVSKGCKVWGGHNTTYVQFKSIFPLWFWWEIFFQISHCMCSHAETAGFYFYYSFTQLWVALRVSLLFIRSSCNYLLSCKHKLILRKFTIKTIKERLI